MQRRNLIGSKRRHTTIVWVRYAAFVALSCVATTALAWLFPEHREIAMLAVQGLDPGRRAAFDGLWQDARAGDEMRLCAQGVDATQGPTPSCIDWAALSAIAGDHSCSSAQMLETVRTSDWILSVAAVAAQLETDLAQVDAAARAGENAEAASSQVPGNRGAESAVNRTARANAVRVSDVSLQRADPGLLTRATSNAAHFPLPRPDTDLDPYAYAQLTLHAGSPLSAIGAYSWYHGSALQKASRLKNEQLGQDERRALARAVLFDEAFALHFLEDMYAAGHVAGSWGDVSERKGTHDFYNANGLEVFTWRGRDKTLVLMGDANMRPEDAAVVAAAVRTSLEQVLDVATGQARGYELPYTPTAPSTADTFDVCTSKTLPERDQGLEIDARYRPAAEEVILQTPVPSLDRGRGELPRFRSEVGTFVGLAGSVDARAIDGSFLASQGDNGYFGGLDVSFRAGVGLEGAVGDASDGLVFGSIGFHSASNSSNDFSAAGTLDGSLGSAIPGRSGTSLRIRMPFYVFPGDLVLVSPMYFTNKEKYTNLAITASNGGVIPWQRGRETRAGRVQFVLGRELGLTFYGRRRTDQLVVPSGIPGDLGQIVNYESLTWELPIVEIRPYRAFSAKQSSSVMFQLFVSADVPDDVSVAYPTGAPAPDLDTVWALGVRMVFDWRHYR